jgi:DNA-binding PadR family transcriptional regulator
MQGEAAGAELNWELLARIRSSRPLRAIVLELLQSTRAELTQRILWKRTGASIGHVPGHLRFLILEGLVECLTPTARRDKLYRLTSKGRAIGLHIVELDLLEKGEDAVGRVLGKGEVRQVGVQGAL